MGLTRCFGTRIAVENLSLRIPAGSVFGFLGPNGAGKTTTVRMLAALIAPTRGTASVGGFGLPESARAVRAAVGLLTETPGLYERLSAWENLRFFGELQGLDRARVREQAARYLKLLSLWDRRDEAVGGFSKGMRQKLAIGRALLHEPAVLFLDEPTAGLDPESSKVVRDFIRALRDDGRTIFLTTHNLAEADELCDLIGIFKTRLVDLGSPDALRGRLPGRHTRVRLGALADTDGALAIARALPFVSLAKVLPPQPGDGHPSIHVELADPDHNNPALVTALVGAGAPIRYVEAKGATLEDVYLRLVEGGAP